jgi:hypothetical protein
MTNYLLSSVGQFTMMSIGGVVFLPDGTSKESPVGRDRNGRCR